MPEIPEEVIEDEMAVERDPEPPLLAGSEPTTEELESEEEQWSGGCQICIIFHGVNEGNGMLEDVVNATIDEGVKRGLFTSGAAIIPIPDEQVAQGTDFWEALNGAS